MPSSRTDESGPLRELGAMLGVQAIDLRAEYEAKLRILTEIQRDVEVLRAAAGSTVQRQQAMDRLERKFGDLAAANRDASDTLKMIRAGFDRVRRRARALAAR